MSARVIWAGLAGGIAGAMVMAAFSMIALWVGRERVLDAAETDRAHVLADSAPGWHVQRRGAGHRRGRAHDHSDTGWHPPVQSWPGSAAAHHRRPPRRCRHSGSI